MASDDACRGDGPEPGRGGRPAGPGEETGPPAGGAADDAAMSRPRKAAIIVALVATIVGLLLVAAAGQLGYDYPGSSIPPF